MKKKCNSLVNQHINHYKSTYFNKNPRILGHTMPHHAAPAEAVRRPGGVSPGRATGALRGRGTERRLRPGFKSQGPAENNGGLMVVYNGKSYEHRFGGTPMT